jgi:hypothetical protein
MYPKAWAAKVVCVHCRCPRLHDTGEVAKQFIVAARLFEPRSAALRCTLASRTIRAAAAITSCPRLNVPHWLVGRGRRKLPKYFAIVRHLSVYNAGFIRCAAPGICIEVHHALPLDVLALAAAEGLQHHRIGHVPKRSVEVGDDARALECASGHEQRARVVIQKADLKNR